MNPEETDEPSDEEMVLWLKTPEGMAAMREVMRKTVAGELGEVPPELKTSAERGLADHEHLQKLLEVQTRVNGLMQGMTEPVEGSRWQHMHDLDEEMKAIMDLLLDLPEPERTIQMQMALPVQEALERLRAEQ
jgi:hypothetical protein